MRDPLLTVSRAVAATSQSNPIPGRTQVQNSAGGYVFQLDDWARLHRFLVLGTEGGTYYVGERELTKDNAQIVFKLIADDGPRVVDHVVRLSEAGDAPKQNPLLFTLAVAASVGDDKTRAAAWEALPRVCRTGTMLFKWNAYCEGMRGWGRARARAVARWYERDVDKIAYQAVKYRQRDGWTHRDMLRLSHPKATSEAQSALFDFVCGRDPAEGALPLVDAYREAQSDGVSVTRIAELVRTGLPWEALPDRFLNEPAVWDGLLDNLGATALLRQLPRLTRIGLVKPMGSVDPRITRLADTAFLRKGRIHPVAVLNALFGYKSRLSRGGQTWMPAPNVIDLLDDAFHASFGALTPAGKRTMIGLDVSGSMTFEKLPSLPALTPADASAAMAMATVRTEPEVLVTAFAGQLAVLPITARHGIADVINIMFNSGLRFGRTDCAQPMLAAQQNNVEVDTFVTFTDNETWAGAIHPTQALTQYRQATGIDARMAVSAMTSTGFSIADPNDPGQLDLVGFDAAAPHLLSEFSRGSL